MKKLLRHSYFLLFNLIVFGQNNLQFAKQFSSTGSIVSNKDFIIKDILADENGSTYFFGYYQGTVDFDPSASLVVRTSISVDGFVVKFDTGGNFIWVNTDNSSGDQEISAAVINSGSVFTNRLTVVQKNSSNSFLLKQINLQTGLTTFTSESFATNSANNIININNIVVSNSATTTDYFLGGSFAGSLTIDSATKTSAGALDAFSCCFRTTSNNNLFAFRWLNSYGGPGNDEVLDLLVPPSASLRLVGYFSQTADFDGNASTNTISRTSNGLKDGFSALVSISNGVPSGSSSVITIGGTGNDVFNNISGQSNTVFICGSFSNTVDFDPSATTNSITSTGGTDGFVARYNGSSSSLAWVKSINTTLDDDVIDITSLESTTRIYYCTSNTLSSGGKRIGIASLFFDGTTNVFGGLLNATSNSTQNYPVAITQDSGDIYTVGVFNDTVDFDPNLNNTFNLSNVLPGNNGFVTKMTTCGFAANTPIIEGNNTTCANQQVSLSILNPDLNNNSNWSWYSSSCGGTLLGVGETITVAPNTNTTYYVRAEGGCAVNSACNAGFTINVNTQPNNGITLSGIALIASEPNASYQWIDCNNGNQNISGATNRNFTPTSSGNYAVLVTNAANCQAQSACFSYNCTSATIPILTGDKYICDSVNLQVPVNILSGQLNNNANWAWYNGSCNGSFIGFGSSKNLGVGTYYVKGVGGCATDGVCSAPFTISFYNPTITITPVANTLVTQNIPGAIYAWTACNDNSIILGDEYIFTPPQLGSYKVYVGWSLSANCASGTGCFEYSGPLDIIENDVKEYNLFPNPVTNSFEIESKEIINQVTIYNALGQKISSFTNQNKYNIENLSRGIYTVEIITDGNKQYSKIIKK